MIGDELPPGAEPEAPQGDLPPGAEAEAPDSTLVHTAPGPAHTVNRTKEENQAQDLATSNAFTADSIRYIAESDKVAPDVRADSIRLSAAYGVPARTVEPNIQAFRDREAADKIDWPKVIEKVPALGRYLHSRPEAIALFKEPGEVDALHGMAWGVAGDWNTSGPPGSDGKLRSRDGGDRFNALDRPSSRAGHWVPPMWFAAIAEGMKAAKSGLILANDYLERGAINLDPRAAAMVDAYERSHPGAADVRDALVKQKRLEAQAGAVPHDYAPAVGEIDAGKKETLHGVAQGLRASAWMRLPTTKYAAEFSDWLAENWGAKRLLARAFQAPFKMAPMIAGTVAAGAVGTALAGPAGGVAGSALFLGEQNLETAHEAVEAASPGGKITPGGRALAVGASALGGAAMAVGFGPIANKLVGDAGTVVIKQIFSSAAQQGVKPTASAIVGGILANAGKHAALGAASMGVQAGLNESAAQVAAGELSVSKIATKSLDATMGSIGDMALLSALGAGREALADRGKAHAQASEAVQYAAAIEAAEASKLIKRSPEVAKQVLNATGGKIHIAAEDWTSYFQSQKIDPEKAATKVLGDDGAAYRSAAASGGDLTIPAGDFLAEFANTPHAEGLAKDVRLNSDSISAKMVERRTKEVEEHVKSEMKRRSPEIGEGKKQVHDFIEKQARAADYSSEAAKAAAELVADTAGTAAARLGSSVAEAAEKIGLHELRISGEKGAAIAEAARAEFRRWVATPDLSRRLQDRLASLSPDARSGEYYRDVVTGALHARAADETPVPPGKAVAVITSLAAKGINDHPTAGGHDVTNDLFKEMADPLNELDPNAARGGTNFRILVDEAKAGEQLADALAKVKKHVGPENIDYIGATGKGAEEAFAKLRTETDRRRALPPEHPEHVPAKGALRPGLDVAALNLKGEKVKSEVPEHLKAKIARLSDREYFELAYVDKIHVTDKNGKRVAVPTGLGTREAFYALPMEEHTLAMDVSGLGKLPKEAGDRLLLALAKAASDAGGEHVRASHLSGDEFAGTHKDKETLERFALQLNRDLAGKVIEYVDPVTGKTERAPIQFRHGVGENYAAADRDLNRKRLAEADRGRGLGEGGPQNDPLPGQERRGILEVGGAPGVRRRARPQAWPADASLAQSAQVAHLDGATVVLAQPPGKGGGDPRGEIRIIFGGGKMVKAEIPKLLGGDKSTMLHEMGHFLSWGFHNLAESDLATPQIRTDYAALLKWAGYDSPEHRYTERGAEASRAKEEKFSHAWEQYIAEGKAPAKPLVRVFNRMKGWMIQIYKGIKGVEDQYQDKYKAPLALTDEVRGIFDRLLATDDAINDARQRVGAGQADPAAVAAMSPDDHTAYLVALGRSRLAGDEETTRRAKQILDDQVGPERDLVRTQVAAELDKLPVHRATRFLQSGEWVGADGPLSGKDLPDWLKDSKGQPLKLNRPDFVAKYGRDASAAAPRGVFAKGKGGTKADELAPRLGFDSGEALAKALGSGEHRDQALARQTQERVDAMFGSARQLLGDVAMEGVHNEHELEARLIEHRALSATVDPAAAKRARTLDPATLKRTVSGLIDDTKVSDLDPARLERAERKAALLAAKLQGAGDGKGAAQAREQRILNFELYRQARDRADGLDKAKARLEAGADDVARARLGKADPAYRDVHDQILEALGLAEPEQGQRETVDSLVSTVTKKGARLDFDPAALREFIAHPKPWEDLTATEARMVSDAAENIRALARFDTEVTIAGKSATRIAKVEELKAAMAKNRKPASFPTPVKRSDPNLLEQAAHIARTAGAMLQDNKAWAVKIDGEGNIDGVGHQLFVDAFIGPRDKAVALTKKVLEPIVEAWNDLPKEIKKLRDQKIDLSSVLPLSEKVLGADRRDNRTRAYLWELFINHGNEGNRQRVRDGNGHTDQQVRAALDLLEKPECDFLQKVLTTVSGGLYEELAALHERDTGLALGKVEATPIETRHGTYPGGYFPLKYDPRFSEPGGKQEIQTLKDLEPPAWARPSSKTGATIERLDQVKGAPVDMEWNVIGNHLAGVVHDIAYREAIRNVGSILLDKDFKSAANDYLGPEYTQAFLPWLQGVAANRADLMSKNVLGAEVSGLARNVVAMGALGFNVSSVLAHSLDFSHAIAAGTRPEYISAGMAKVIGYRFGAGDGWDKMREAVLEASPELRYRDAARDGGFKKALADMEKAPNSIRRGIQTAAFKMHELSEITQETAVFLGRQAQELAAGKSTEEATKIADDVVRQLLPSQDIASKPPILRTKWGLGAVIMFYGYANKLYNLYLARPVDRTVQAYRNPATGDRVAATAALAGKLMAMAILGASTKWVRGAGRKKDDDESVAGFMTKQLALEPAGTVPILGPIIDSFVTGRKIDIRSAPEAEFAKGVAERLAAAYKHFSDGEESDAYEKLLSAAELAVDIGAGTHVGQASKTADYLKKAHSGEVEPRGAGDWIGGLLFGDHKGDPANPATAAQDWVSGK